MNTALIRHLNRPLVHLAMVALLGLLVYSNTFEVPFNFDDIAIIVDNAYIKDTGNIPSFFFGYRGPFASRPLLLATAALDYRLGGLDPTGYHAVNLALHILNAMLLYLLVVMTGRRLNYDEKAYRPVAALSALIFVAHPLHTEAVISAVNRSMLFATAFYLAGIMLFLKSLEAAEGRRRIYYGVGLFAASLLGAASREDFSTFPVMLLLYDLFFISRFRFFNRKISPRPSVTPLAPLKLRGDGGVMPSAAEAVDETVAGHWRAYLPVLAGMLYMAFALLAHSYDQSADYPGIGNPPLEYALTQFKVHWTYLRLLALPIGQNADYDYPASLSFFEFPTLAAFAGYLGLWAFAVLHARKRPVAAFGALWFVVTLLPVSFGVVFLDLRLGDMAFEHRAYLPSAALTAAAVAGAMSLAGGREARRNAAVALLLAMALLLAVAAHARNEVWRTDASFWEDVVEKSPGKDRGHYNLALAYKARGLNRDAIRHFESATKMRTGISASPHDLSVIIKDQAHYGLGLLYEQEGSLEKAIEHYETALKIDRDFAAAHNSLGILYRQKGRTDKAIEHYRAALAVKPENPEFHNNLGNALDIEERTDEAITEYLAAVRINPGYAVAHYNLAIAYMRKGMTEEAVEHYRLSADGIPGFAEPHYSLGRIYMDRGDIEAARAEFEAALRINSGHYWAKQFLDAIEKGKAP